MKNKCVTCGHIGELGSISNLKDDTTFIVKQWYKDNKGMIHTLLICSECGTFHDSKLSIFGMIIKKPYKTIGYMTKKDVSEHINMITSKKDINYVDDDVLKEVGINRKIMLFMEEKEIIYTSLPYDVVDGI